MRLFVIADASKRKAKPVAILLWKPHASRKQGTFALETATSCSEADLPLSLSFCATRKNRRATARESEEWVRSRIVPKDRHNIAEVLQSNGLVEYDEVSLLAASKGISSDDDYRAYEVPLSVEVEHALAKAESGSSMADRVIAAVGRKSDAREVRYAFVKLPGETQESLPECDPPNATRRIAAKIRSERISKGLTQKQLAARAGITQTVLSRTESGKGNPTLELLEDIAAALGMTLDVSLK